MRKALCSILLAFLSFASMAQSEECSLKKDKDGIKVYTCKAENERFKVLRAEFVIHNTTPEELEQFLHNVPNYPSWQYNMLSAKIIRHNKDDNTFIICSEIDAPWPVENRELVVQFSVQRFADKDKLQFTVKTIPYDYPSTKGLIRVPFHMRNGTYKNRAHQLR